MLNRKKRVYNFLYTTDLIIALQGFLKGKIFRIFQTAIFFILFFFHGWRGFMLFSVTKINVCHIIYLYENLFL